MFPLILISKDSKFQEDFVELFIRENNFHPSNIQRILPEKKELSIDQIREIKLDTAIHFSSPRLFILEEFDGASSEAQNGFLKTLEEKNSLFQFIMFAKNEESILPTVRSRSKVVYVERKQQIKLVDPELALLFSKLISDESYAFIGNPLLMAINAVRAESFIDDAILFFRERLSTDRMAAVAINKLFYYKLLLLRNNLNPQLTVDNALIFIHKLYKLKHT